MIVGENTHCLCEWEELLSRPNFDPNALGDKGKNLLHHALNNFEIDFAKYLIQDDRVNVNVPDQRGEYPIHFAAFIDKRKITKLLLKNPKIDPNVLDFHAKSAVKIAVENLSFKTLKVLVVHENVRIDFSVEELLRLESDLFSIIAKGAARLTETDEEGNTILHRLVPKANTIMRMQQLLENDFNLDLQNIKGETALHLACKNGIEDGDVSYESLLSELPSIGCNLEKIKLLVKYKASLDIQDHEGRTPLARAILCDNMDAAEFLVSQGANMDIVDMPAHIRAELSQSKLVI